MLGRGIIVFADTVSMLCKGFFWCDRCALDCIRVHKLEALRLGRVHIIRALTLRHCRSAAAAIVCEPPPTRPTRSTIGASYTVVGTIGGSTVTRPGTIGNSIATITR